MAHTINFREPDSIRHTINPWLVSLLGLIIAIAGGCASGGKNMTKAESACSVVRETDRKEPPGVLDNADDLLTVDCLLPGQDIQIGQYQRWMTPPRPAIISAWECKVGGGQYAIGYNRDARQKALDVWQQCADEGDKIAQNYLGEIYARSWGDIKPDFSHAAEWFRKAAEQGYSRAQKNLGALYEQGLGVPKDPETALKFYRQAIGQVAPVSLDQNTKGEIQELSKKLDTTDQNTKTLQQQLSAAELLLRQKQEELDKLKRPNAPEDNQAQVKALQKELEKAYLDEQKLREQLSDAKQKLEMARGQLGKTKAHAALGVMPKTGQYYALIIGINDYQAPIPQLNTPVNDAKGVDAVLRQKYGFKTTLLVDDTSIKPTRDGILKVLNDMGKKLKEDDSLLIYYAGHGEISSNRGHWLPQDAELNDDKNWISSDDIRKKIETTTMKAKHVLIVADSCYSAAVTTAAITTIPTTIAASPSIISTRSPSTNTEVTYIPSGGIPDLTDTSPEAQVGWIKALAERLSRTALTSGGFEPVLDQDSGNGLSIFANAFVEALAKNNDVISAQQISFDIKPEVFAKAKKIGGSQVPGYAPIQHTGDNFGEFFFVRNYTQGNFQNGKYQIAAAASE